MDTLVGAPQPEVTLNDSVTALLDLQTIDRARDRLHDQREHLPLRAELADVQARITEVNGAIARVQKEADDLEHGEKRVEEEVNAIEAKIASEEDKMYSGKVINPKEVAAIQDEVAMLKRRKSPLEEQGLEELEARDQLLTERQRLQEELADLEREANEVRARIAEAEGKIDNELQTEEQKRAGVLPAIPSDTLELYEAIRVSKRGVAVGALEKGICTACSEALSAVEVDRIKAKARTGEWLFRCEHCRRLLVVT
jgi:predicted  nucleic acid-binding Zn-ribbon protein